MRILVMKQNWWSWFADHVNLEVVIDGRTLYIYENGLIIFPSEIAM